jgi:Ca2+-binding RTX toxin-like protein
VDLAGAPPGGAATGDVVAGFENLTGGGGNDTLAGDAGPNVIETGFGGNVVAGRGGDDTIRGAPGADAVDGGSGDDQIDGDSGHDRLEGGDGDDGVAKLGGSGLLRGGAGDDLIVINGAQSRGRSLRFACDAGADIISANRRAVVALDCEEMIIGDTYDGELALPLRLRGRYAVLRVRADAGERGRVVLRDPRTGRVLGSASWRARGRRVPVTVRVPLRAATVRRARRAGRLTLIVQAIDVGGDGADFARTTLLAR